MKKKTKKRLGIFLIILISVFILFSLNIDKSKPLAVGVYADSRINKTKSFSFKFSPLSISPTCSVSSSIYNICYQWENIHYLARAYVKIETTTNVVGTKKGGYYVGEVYLPYKFQGRDFYLYENMKDDSTLWRVADCWKDGCLNFKQRLPNEGKLILAKNPGDTYNGCPMLIAHDYNENPNGDWSYIAGAYGWFGEGNCLNIRSITCWDNTDCNSNEYCSKIGNWNEWQCNLKECDFNQEKCEGNIFFSCKDFKWFEEGIKLNKCGIECREDIHCSFLNEQSDNYCKDNNVFKQVTKGYCELIDNSCKGKVSEVLVEECNEICVEGKCTEKEIIPIIPIIPKQINLYMLVGILFIIFIILILLMRKRR